MGTMIGRISTNLSSPAAAYNSARKLAKVAVTMEQIEAGTKAAAIESLTRKGKFGSWLLKLYKGHSVSIHLHHYVRLVEIVENLAVKTKKNADHIEAVVAEMRGSPNDNSYRAPCESADRGSDQFVQNFARAV